MKSNEFENKLFHNLLANTGSSLDNEKILLSISGGIDSLVLFDVLNRNQQKYNYRLFLFHTNYNMHNKSIEMLNLCKSLSNKNNLKIFTESINSKKIFKNKNFESSARDFRYKKIKNICENHNIKYVLTAHHEDDQIETVYMHEELLNSSWISKIGIREKSFIDWYSKNDFNVCLIRPMLKIAKNQIIEYAKSKNIYFIDDPTNNDLSFLRNKIRNTIKNKKDSKFRNFYLNIGKQNNLKMKSLSEDLEIKKKEIINFYKKNELIIINKKKLLNNNDDFLILFFKQIIKNNFNYNCAYSSKFWLNLRDFLYADKKHKFFNFKDDIKICKSTKHIYVFNSTLNKSADINKIGNHFLKIGNLSVCLSQSPIIKRPDHLYVTKEMLKNIKLDFWRYGDKCIDDRGISRKVSDVFINNKVSIFEKRYYPIIKYNNEIIWIPNLIKTNIEIDEKDKILIVWNSLL